MNCIIFTRKDIRKKSGLNTRDRKKFDYKKIETHWWLSVTAWKTGRTNDDKPDKKGRPKN